MSVTSWGKCSIFIQKVGTKKNEWDKLDTPKEDSTQITPTKGDTMTQTEEGGGTVDRKTKKSTYEAAYQLFYKKAVAQPFQTIDGVIEGNYRLAIQPEDSELPGVYMGNTTVGAEEAYTTADGALITYTHSALIPDGDPVAKTTDAKGDDVYCAYRWRIITATKQSGGKYALTFKYPEGSTEGTGDITETYTGS
jgi:hypothetical protein|nr:MAG TPA: hypothetical protein [Caudoviricetes sp.]